MRFRFNRTGLALKVCGFGVRFAHAHVWIPAQRPASPSLSGMTQVCIPRVPVPTQRHPRLDPGSIPFRFSRTGRALKGRGFGVRSAHAHVWIPAQRPASPSLSGMTQVRIPRVPVPTRRHPRLDRGSIPFRFRMSGTARLKCQGMDCRIKSGNDGEGNVLDRHRSFVIPAKRSARRDREGTSVGVLAGSCRWRGGSPAPDLRFAASGVTVEGGRNRHAPDLILRSAKARLEGWAASPASAANPSRRTSRSSSG